MRKRNFQQFVLSQYLFLACCIYFVSFAAYSNNGNVAISPATQASIEQEQRERLQEIERAKQSVQQLNVLPTLPAPEASQTQQCFPVQQVVFLVIQSFLISNSWRGLISNQAVRDCHKSMNTCV